MAYQPTNKTTTTPAKKPTGNFEDSFVILGSGWKPKSGNDGANLVLNQDATFKKGTRLNLFATKNKKEETSPDYVLCMPKDQ